MAESSLAQRARSGIYEIVNTVNGKRYVGSAKSFHLRWKAHRLHLNRGSHHSPHMQSSWSKHGAEKFEFRILLICAPEHLILYEQIALDVLAPEFNVCRKAGSMLGTKRSPEQRAKLSAAKMGNTATLGYKHRPESIEKLRAKQLGIPSPTKGKKRPSDAVTATANAHRGMKRSDETRAKIAAKAKGRIFFRKDDQYKTKLSLASKGKKKSPEHMAALQAGRAKRIYTEDERQAIGARIRLAYQTGQISREKSDETRMRLSQAIGKLNADDVLEIRRQRTQGMTGRSLASRFGVPPSTITKIMKGHTYRWVQADP